MKKNKIIKLIITTVTIAVVGGAIYGVYSFRKDKVRVEVQEISTLDYGEMESQMNGYGEIISDGSQSIYLTQDNVIKEILVVEGQSVVVGDPLLSYDMTKANIQLELKKLELEKLQYEIAIAQNEYKGLLAMKPTVPVVPVTPIEPIVPPGPVLPDPEPDGETAPEGKATDESPVIVPPVVKESDKEEPIGYTLQELEKKRYEKQKQIQDLDLRLRIGKLEMVSLEEAVSSGVVKAQINGVVKKVRDPNEGNNEMEPLLFLSQSEGLYLYGNLSELQLMEVKPGQIVMCNSWQTGAMFEAEIKEIENFPNPMYSEGNGQNISYYGFKAYIADTTGLNVGDGIEFTVNSDGESGTKHIYLPKAYVREKDGKYYVMLEGKNKRLKIQYVKVGKVLYGAAYEILSGVKRENKIAFPYGKDVKEGTKTKLKK